MDDLAGLTFLVTGGNTGIGLATARRARARRRPGLHRVPFCQTAGEAAARRSRPRPARGGRFPPLDLAPLASVRACARAFLGAGEPLHVLINNAGVGGQRGLTADGVRAAFGVNHLGHFALTAAADRPPATQRPGPGSHRGQRRALPGPGRGLRGPPAAHRQLHRLREYAVSKLCNVLFAAGARAPPGRSGVTPTRCTRGWSPPISGGGCRGLGRPLVSGGC